MGTQKTGCRWDDRQGGPTRWGRYFREMVTFTWPRFRVCFLHRLFRLLESNWHKILQFMLHVQPKTLFSPSSGQANLWFPTERGQGYLKFKTLLHANTIICICICQHQWMMYLHWIFAQDGVTLLPIRLTQTDHLQLPSSVHLEIQLLLERKWVALTVTMTAASRSYNRSIRVLL